MEENPKSRKFLLLICTVLILYHAGQVEFSPDIKNAIFLFKLKNPAVIPYMLWGLWTFFLWQYWLVTHNCAGKLYELAQKNLKEMNFFIKLVEAKAKKQQPNFHHSRSKSVAENTLVDRKFLYRTLYTKTNGNGLNESLRFYVSPMNVVWYKILIHEHAFKIKKFFKDEEFANYYTPYIGAALTVIIAAVFECCGRL